MNAIRMILFFSVITTLSTTHAQDPTQFPNIGFTEFMTAIDEGRSYEHLDEILKTTPQALHTPSLLGLSPLHFGSRKLGLPFLQYARERQAALKTLDPQGRSLFHHLAFQAAFPEVDADHLVHLVPPSFFQLSKWYDENRNLDERYEVLLKYLLNAGYLDRQSSIHFDSPDQMGVRPLMIAAALGHLSLIKILLALNADIHATTEDQLNVTAFAIEFRRPLTLELLVAHGAEWDAIDSRGEGPFHKLFKQVDLDQHPKGVIARDRIFYYLVNKGANPNVPDLKRGLTALHLACARGEFEYVKYLIEQAQADYLLPTQNSEPQTCLQLAIQSQNEKLIDYLLNLKGSILSAKTLSQSPLIEAIKMNDQATVMKLLDSDILLDFETSAISPLNYAASFNRHEIIPRLVEKGCVVNGIKAGGETALSTSIRAGARESFETLLALGADPNTFWMPEEPALILAYTHGHDWAWDALTQHPKINWEMKNSDGDTLAHLMVRARRLEDLERLANALPPQWNNRYIFGAKNNKGNTPLHEAVEFNDLELVRFLGLHGASPWTNNREGKSPREIAAQHGYQEILAYLTALEATIAPSSYEDFELEPR